jgi:large subunit ribosomal protein L26e
VRFAVNASLSLTRRRPRRAAAAPASRPALQIRSIPIRKEDEVQIVRGRYKGREGKVTAVYRKKFVIHVERITRDKANGAPVPVGIDASNVIITKLKTDKVRSGTRGGGGGRRRMPAPERRRGSCTQQQQQQLHATRVGSPPYPARPGQSLRPLRLQDRKAIIERKAAGKVAGQSKGKYSESMAQVD